MYKGDASGVWIYESVKKLLPRYEVHVIFADYSGSFKRAPKISEPFYSYPIKGPANIVDLPSIHKYQYLTTIPLFIRMATKLRSLVKQGKVDLIDANWAVPSGFLASLCCRNTPLVITLRGSDINIFGKKPIFQYLVKYALKKATRIITVSNNLKYEAIKLGAREDRISVIPSGIDTNKFRPMDKQRLMTKLRLPDGFIILFAGNLVKLKGIDKLLRISVNLSKEFDFHLLIAGDGPEMKNLEELANRLGLSNILFKGMISYQDMPFYMAASDILVLPSESEGLPGCVQEAMACGMPTVASNVGGLPDIITNGVNGYLVNNEEEMEERLRLMMSSPSLMASMGANALEFAKRNLCLDAVVEKTEKLYHSILKQ